MEGITSDQAVVPPPKLLLWKQEPLTQNLDAQPSVAEENQKYRLKKPESLVISPPRRFFRTRSLQSSAVSPYPLDPLTPAPNINPTLSVITAVEQKSTLVDSDKDLKGKRLVIPPFPTDVMTQYIPHHNENSQMPPRSSQSAESIMNKSFRQLIRLSRATAWLIPKAIAATASSPTKPATVTSTESTQNPFSLAGYSNTSDLIPLRLPSFDEFSKGSDMDQLSSFREELFAQSDNHDYSFSQRMDNYRRNLRFNVHQITSLTSARDLDYELLVQVNQETVAVRYGQLKKLAKGISSCSLPEDWLSLKVTGPFELSIVINTKPTRHSKVADYLARRGLWPLWSRKRQEQQQQQPDPASSTQLSCWSSSSEASDSPVAPSSASSLQSAFSATNHTLSSGMISSGYLEISSGKDMDLIENGQHRYRLSKPHASKKGNSYTTSLNIELLMEFVWQAQRPSDRVVSPSIQDTAISSSSSNKNGPLSSFAYPWLRYPGVGDSSSGVLSPLSPEAENEDRLLADKDAIHAAMSHASKGDHLTFYLYELASPKWERYWVTLHNKRLQIISSVNKSRNPTYDLSLNSLVQVSKPTEEDQEHVCLNRKVGIVLQLAEDEASNATPLGNRIYILADTPDLALHWIRALTVIKSNNQIQKATSL